MQLRESRPNRWSRLFSFMTENSSVTVTNVSTAVLQLASAVLFVFGLVFTTPFALSFT
jgi:hypothetical protein